jgi:O-acetyl-ADP-ribose deacetylase (regulator of RNase III)
MLKYIDTTVFNADTQTIVNTINCVGVMGAGLALEFQLRFPEMARDYTKRCAQKEVKIGRPYLYKEYGTPLILNFPTKNHWKYPSKIDWIQKGLEYFALNYKRGGITSIAFPKLGCDRGGLDWREVSTLMEKYLKDLDINIYICLDKEAQASGIEGIMVNFINNETDLSWASELNIRSDIRSKIVNSLPIRRFRELRQLEGVGKQTYNEIFQLLYKMASKPIYDDSHERLSRTASSPLDGVTNEFQGLGEQSEKQPLEASEFKIELKDFKKSTLEKATSQATSDVGETLPENLDAFWLLWPYLEQILNQERTKEEIAQKFKLPKGLIRDWLARAEELGKVKKLLRPVRYIAKDFKKSTLEKATSQATSDVGETLPENLDAFWLLWPYLEQILNQEHTKEEIAQRFRLPKGLIRDWLARAEELGKVKKLLRPVRYIAADTLSHQQLDIFDELGNGEAKLRSVE